MAQSKRYKSALAKTDPKRNYQIDEAIELLLTLPKAKFDETVEVSFHLGVDPRQSDQMVRGSVVLPHGTGRKIRVLVFCEPEKENEAGESGADYIGSQDLIDKISGGWLDFDYCISTPSMMKLVSRLGKVLGPRGLMPSPKTGAVTENIGKAVQEAKRGKIDFRMDKFGGLHAGIGKLSFTKEQLTDNFNAFVNALIAAKPSGVKGDLIKSVYLSATMSPSLKITGVNG